MPKEKEKIKINYSDLGKIDAATYAKWQAQQEDHGETFRPQTRAERFKEWVEFAPAPVVFLCKIFKLILDVGGFAFMVGGGIAMLYSAWAIWQACSVSGWRGLLDWNAAYIVGYFAGLTIINKLRSLMFRIVNRV